MTSHFKLTRFPLFILFISFLVAACNSNDGDEKKTDEKPAADSGKIMSQIAQPAAALISGTLDTLWTDSLSFASLPKKKIVFCFTFRRLDTLTLHGWAAEKDSIFTTNPDIELIKGHASALNYGNDMYFGNVIIKRGHLALIKNKLIQEKAKYVLFAPQIVNGNHIGYRVFVTKDDPVSLVKAFTLRDTGVDANPSPPKNY